MFSDHINKLTKLFNEADDLQADFKKGAYETAFNRIYADNLSMLDEINADVEGKDEEFVNAYITELADDFVGIFKPEYDAIEKKGKKSTFVTNHNTPLVTYVFPVILHYSAKWCKPCVEKIVEKWNEAFTETTIGYGTYEDLKAGFKYKLCYITTAVCESLNKPDDCRELNLLREYRDEILMNEEGGEALIDEYYDIAPTIVKRINRLDNNSEVYCGLYDDFIVKCIDCIEAKHYEQCRKTYTEMVTELKNKYAY